MENQIIKKEKPPKIDLSGKTFGFWTVLNFEGRQYYGNQGHILYKVRCKCGFETVIKEGDLKYNKSTMCRSCATTLRHKNRSTLWYGPSSPNWKGTKDIPLAQYTKFKYGAKKRNIPFDLSIEDLQELWDKQQGKCIYSGKPLIFNNKHFRLQKGKTYFFASLDRIDSTKAYTKDNIQWICAEINLMKCCLNDNDFKKLIKDMYFHIFKEN